MKAMLRSALLCVSLLNGVAAFADDPIIPRIPPIILNPREISCADFMKYYFDWASGVTPAPEDNRWVGITLVYNQQKNTLKPGIDANQSVVGYSAGALRFTGSELVGDVTSYFNDRLHADQCDGGFCDLNQPFSQRATDVAQITITTTGMMKTVLKSWGNATYTDQLVCMSNGIAYVPTKRGKPHMQIITLVKSGARTPR